MGLLDRVFAARRGVETRMGIDQWLTDYLIPSTFNYGGSSYLYGGTGYSRTMVGDLVTEISNTLPAYSAALRQAPPAFAAQMVRALILSQARFTFRRRPSSGQPRNTFGTRALSVLEKPGNGLTTAKMLARMEWHAGLAGNAYVYRQAGKNPGDPPRLRVLRPDWVAILWGSESEPEDAPFALDAELIGYVYWNGGFGGGYPARTLLPSEVCHWAPLPDTEHAGLGMSWVTPALREIQGDRAATEHKLRFFANGATPALVVKGLTGTAGQPLTREQFDNTVDMMERRHAGVTNAYRTLYLTAGADATVVGADLKQIDFKATQGGGETRISFLSRVPASLLGISEGLAGSSLNAGNFGMSRRIFADSWVYPSLQDLAGSFQTIVDVPNDAELWFDTSDMPILREDSKDQADILNTQVGAISAAVTAGFTPESAVAAIQSGDLSMLKHTGLFSVQLQPPANGQMGGAPAGPGPSDGGAPATGGEPVPADATGADTTAAVRAIEGKLADLAHRMSKPEMRPSTPKPKPPADRTKTMPAVPTPADLRRYLDPVADARRALAGTVRTDPDAEGSAAKALQILGHDPIADRDVVAEARQALEEDDLDDAPIEDEETLALVIALNELGGTATTSRGKPFDSAEHPRGPGGRFRRIVDRLKDAIEQHHASGGKGDPFAEFSREQLRRVARARGITLRRGEDRESIAAKLLDDLSKGKGNAPEKPAKKPDRPAAQGAQFDGKPSNVAGEQGHSAVIGNAIKEVEALPPGWRANRDALARGRAVLDELAKVYKGDPQRLELINAARPDFDYGHRLGVVERLTKLDQDLTNPPTPSAATDTPPVAEAARELHSLDEIMANMPSYRVDPEGYQKALAEREAALKKVVEGHFGNLRTEVTNVSVSPTYTFVDADLYDDTGRSVGHVRRSFRREESGNLVATHNLLEIAPDAQGSGFAREFNGHLFDWYRQSGVDRVEVHANIDVGGYTWAAQGFDFDGDAALDDWVRIARAKIDTINGEPYRFPPAVRDRFEQAFAHLSEEQRKKQLDMMDALLTRAEIGEPVSAFEISQLGRKPGQGRDDMWIGKFFMLGSDWQGVLRL